jgi:hypothetical protein
MQRCRPARALRIDIYSSSDVWRVLHEIWKHRRDLDRGCRAAYEREAPKQAWTSVVDLLGVMTPRNRTSDIPFTGINVGAAAMNETCDKSHPIR